MIHGLSSNVDSLITDILKAHPALQALDSHQLD